ncbi:hypothetical protein MMC11_006745 [Xylographa trunciseda]|nr:hypothetical protein [Xylographa trunciseda]
MCKVVILFHAACEHVVMASYVPCPNAPCSDNEITSEALPLGDGQFCKTCDEEKQARADRARSARVRAARAARFEQAPADRALSEEAQSESTDSEHAASGSADSEQTQSEQAEVERVELEQVQPERARLEQAEFEDALIDAMNAAVDAAICAIEEDAKPAAAAPLQDALAQEAGYEDEVRSLRAWWHS